MSFSNKRPFYYYNKAIFGQPKLAREVFGHYPSFLASIVGLRPKIWRLLSALKMQNPKSLPVLIMSLKRRELINFRLEPDTVILCDE